VPSKPLTVSQKCSSSDEASDDAADDSDVDDETNTTSDDDDDDDDDDIGMDLSQPPVLDVCTQLAPSDDSAQQVIHRSLFFLKSILIFHFFDYNFLPAHQRWNNRPK